MRISARGKAPGRRPRERGGYLFGAGLRAKVPPNGSSAGRYFGGWLGSLPGQDGQISQQGGAGGRALCARDLNTIEGAWAPV